MEQQQSQEQQPQQPRESRRRSDQIIRYSGMATQMAVTIFLGVWGGKKLDEYLKNETPVFTLILSLLGVVIAMYNVIKDFIRKKP
ncbi:MAG: AtpZ/AtpI family protein [Flavobacteriales bacterium]|nr:AtpZ/AtpI family protein [Flavobacteriales bacterium]